MSYKPFLVCVLFASCFLAGCQDHRLEEPVQPTVTTVVNGLIAPIGIETDGSGRLFVSEQGTGKNDGRVLEITPDGNVYPVVTGLYSVKRPDNELDATDHLLAANGVLYILNAKGLYSIKLASVKAGSAPISASGLIPEPIQQFVIDYPFAQDTDESHPYNMTLGPDGAIYIADAAANAIIRRSATGQLSIVSAVPGITNSNPAGPPPGPPVIESVPTGIVFDGKQFAISTLLGFPFPAGKALIYQMDLAGKISTFQQTFNSLIDIENDGSGNYLVLEFASFGPTGFAPKTGRLIRAKGSQREVILDNLNLPTDLKIVDEHTAYLTSLGDGTLSKIKF